MFGIGELARATGVKVTTIRYFEEQGLLGQPGRSSGNQRRYGRADLERLSFIRHARELGFDQKAIAALLDLAHQPAGSCEGADELAARQLQDVRAKIARLRQLEHELERVVSGCAGGKSADCLVLGVLGDHSLCESDHPPPGQI